MRVRAYSRWAYGLLLSGLLIGCWAAATSAHAQTDVLLFEATDHIVDDEHGFLSYLREHPAAARLLGAPVSGTLNEDGRFVQYFERGRLELHSELEGQPVLLGRIGADYAAALWKRFAPAPAGIPAAGEQFFDATDQTLREPFLSFWNDNGNIVTLGYPISQPVWEYVDNQLIQVQYFERGRLEHHPLSQGAAGDVRASALGRELALLRGYDLAPPALDGVPVEVYDAAEMSPPAEVQPESAAAETSVETAEEPAEPAVEQVAEVSAPAFSSLGNKYIIVSLSQQWLYAYEGDVLVFDAPVATGRDGFNTPVGNFAIYAKNSLQTMSGTIGGETYLVPNVPHAMYIHGGVALHGTYWHNLFGSGIRPSHGCINLPTGSAAWLYDWAPVGTSVQVTY